MFTQFFGHYLLNKGLVTPKQLAEALDYQQSTRLKFGVIAINSGYMTAEQVMRVHDSQTRVDKKFGEIAIELGYLTDEKLNEILSAQKSGHLLLGQALIDKGYMTMTQFENALNSYKKDNSLSDEQFGSLQSGNIQEIVDMFYGFESSPYKEHYKSYFSLLLKNIIRFIDPEVRPEHIIPIDEHAFDQLAFQEVLGKINIFTGLDADENSFIGFGSSYAKELFSVNDELTKASVGEFLNLQNGLFLVNMSDNGMELNLEPQDIREKMTLRCPRLAYIIPLNFSFGKVNFIISEAPAKMI